MYSNHLACLIASISENLFALFETKWLNDILLKPELRTYIQIKHNYAPEPYVKEIKGP